MNVVTESIAVAACPQTSILRHYVRRGGSGSSDTHTAAAPAPTEPINSEPEVPADFAGTITPSLPLTDAERVLLEQASRLHELRNPINEDPTMRGFGPATKAAQP